MRKVYIKMLSVIVFSSYVCFSKHATLHMITVELHKCGKVTKHYTEYNSILWVELVVMHS